MVIKVNWSLVIENFKHEYSVRPFDNLRVQEKSLNLAVRKDPQMK